MFWYAKMVDEKDLYQHLTMMSNLANKFEEVIMSSVMDKDFVTTMCFSIMGISQYANIIKKVMNSPVLERAHLI
jgi:hypothetical protein